MAPQEVKVKVDHEAAEVAPEKVVISGVSGLFPNARNIKEFSEILYGKKDPITTEQRRWDFKHPELPEHFGLVPELDRFDSQFFKLSHRVSSTMDVMSRKLLEQVYQAIYDAGLSPEHICGKNIGVFVGACFSETEKACFYSNVKTGSGLVGCSKSMFANRISYWLDLKGPSFALDQSCCSSIASLEFAYEAIARGECEAAIVGAGHISMHPQTLIHYGRLLTLSPDGKTKSFDENADGCVQSEAIAVLFLQKAKDALRIYADVVHVKSDFTKILDGENGPKYGFYRDAALMSAYLKKFYMDAKVSPNAVEYVEAFGAGTPEIDKAELDTFEEVFCNNREKPLIVGSVMSNVGYTEAVSGIVSVAKVLLGYQKGKIAANINCKKPRKDVPAVRDNRMIIATDHEPLERSYTAINNLSYNGINAHVLLNGHYKPKNLAPYMSKLPRLVTISGRQENAVKRIFEDLKSRPIDPEELALLDNIHKKSIAGHLGRGFAILEGNKENQTICLDEKVEYFDDVKRPLWFVYSGMGSQWNKMGLELMKIPTFAAAIERCHNILKTKGVDLKHILTTEDKTIFDNILHAFVGITAVQIGLTDVLKEIGIEPDNLIGHSLGEVGCAYADGAFTAEQAILVSYTRGRVSVEIPAIRGSMAAVGLGYQQIKDMCPSDIVVACHNGPDSSTLSGPEESMKAFVAKLTEQGIFAKEVQTCNIAYHSKYIQELSEPHERYLKEIITEPVMRSDRWISTSVPQERKDEDIAKYSSAYYHNYNMMHPVLFEEALTSVPSNAVLIEIAPHGLLQAILKRSLSSDCRNIPLTKRGHDDNAIHVLSAIGRLYVEGYNPAVGNLYPKVEFPVSTETPSLSHLVEWTHDEKWNLPLYISGEERRAAATKHFITLHDEEYKYLHGNVIRGRVVYPFAAALVATWETLALSLGLEKRKMSVHFHDLHLFAQPILHEQRQLKLNVILHRGTGKFEISDDISKVATGYIIGNLTDLSLPKVQFESTEPLNLESKDVYELLRERDYNYRDNFCTIFKANASLNEAQLLWNDNWITLIDGMLQLNALKQSHSSVSQPTYIRRICIDVDDHITKIKTSEDKKVLTAHINDVHDFTRCGGIILENIKFHTLPPVIEDSVIMKTKKFFPLFQSDVVDMSVALQVFLQIVSDNVKNNVLNVISVVGNQDLSCGVLKTVKDVIMHNKNINYTELPVDAINGEADLILINDLSTNEQIFKKLYKSLRPEAFVLNFKSRPEEKSSHERPSSIYRILSSTRTEKHLLELIKIGTKELDFAAVVTIASEADVFMLKTKLRDLPLHKGLLLVAIQPLVPGLKEQIKKWKEEIKGSKISMVVIDRNVAGDETLDKVPELAFSELKNGVWGGEYLLPWEGTSAVNYGVKLWSSRIGVLDSLKWVESTEASGPGVVVDVHYAGLNNCDVKRATGVIPFKEGQDFVYGMDFSGVTDSGTRVMGIVSGGAVASKVVARPELLWDVPEKWSLEEATTVPLAYSMAFYCLNIKAEITHGMTILVLGGAGALGQAAISIALSYGCKIFTTVSDNNKKQLLLKLFPDLEEKNIGYSRDGLFGDMVLRATKGEGCDIVLCCATGVELKNIALNCCAFSGVTIDTVQVLTKEKFAFGLHHLTKQRSYMTVDFSSIFTRNNLEEMETLKKLVSDGIAQGYVKPLTYVTYGPKDVVTAFKLLESTRRSGRVLIRLSDVLPEVESRFTCSPDEGQMVFCDDVLGIQFAEKLISHGARKLHLNCASKPGHLLVKLRSWEKMGVETEISSEDFTKPNVLESLLHKMAQKGPIEGIYTILANTAVKGIAASISKLNEMSKNMCRSLKHFVVASSDDTFGDEIYSNRMQEHLPVTVVHLPLLFENGAQKTSNISRRAAIDAMVKILTSDAANVIICGKENKCTSLLSELASIADHEIQQNVSEETTLKDLGFPSNKMQAIKSYLRDSYNIYFEENAIPSLTVQKIRDIEKSASWYGFEDKRGLQVFYSHIDDEEIAASAPTILMKTRAKYCREGEFDAEKPSLCVIPGFEGHHARFNRLCERLKLPAFVLQPGFEKPQESVQDMAQRLARTLEKKMKIKENFCLLGYESGVLLALETAKVLEKDGRKGTIFCIGQTPEELKNTIEELIKTLDETGEKLEDAVARHIVNLIKGNNNAFDKIESEIKLARTWQDKLEICVEATAGHNGHSAQYIRAIINAALGRIQQYKTYRSEPFKLDSKIILLHSASKFDPKSMQRYSKEPITVYELDTPLEHVAQDLRCTTLINQNLNPDVLDLFERNNLCETYLLNGNTFLFVQCPE